MTDVDRVVSADGTPIAYELEGSGEPLVLVDPVPLASGFAHPSYQPVSLRDAHFGAAQEKSQ